MRHRFPKPSQSVTNERKAKLRIPHATPILQRRRHRHARAALPLLLRVLLRVPVSRVPLRHGRLPVALLRRKALLRRGRVPRRRPAPASVVDGGHGAVGGDVLGARAAAAVRAPAAAQDAEDERAAETGRQTDDEGEVLVDPGFDFVADGAVAAALLKPLVCVLG